MFRPNQPFAFRPFEYHRKPYSCPSYFLAFFRGSKNDVVAISGLTTAIRDVIPVMLALYIRDIRHIKSLYSRFTTGVIYIVTAASQQVIQTFHK